MSIIRFVSIVASLFFLNISYSQPPVEILRSCIDLKPQNPAITLTQLIEGTVSQVNESNCEDKFTEDYNGHIFGMVTCNDIFYLIINDKKIKASTAINLSVNPEITPGNVFSNRAMWHKIDYKEVGAKAGSILFSLIETCKQNKVEVFSWLKYVLTHIHQALTIEQLEKLLPYNIYPQLLTDMRSLPYLIMPEKSGVN